MSLKLVKNRNIKSFKCFSQKKYNNKNGLLIVIEGISGSGKSQMINTILEHFPEEIDKINIIKWNSIKIIRKIIHFFNKIKILNSTIYSFFQWLSFFIDYFFKIKILLKKGNIVIADRYFYTGIIRDKVNNSKFKIIQIFKNFLIKPDVLIFCNTPIYTCVKRINKRNKRLFHTNRKILKNKEIKNKEFHYLFLLKKEYLKLFRKMNMQKETSFFIVNCNGRIHNNIAVKTTINYISEKLAKEKETKMENKLPIEYPFINGRMIYGFTTAIVNSYKKNNDNWILNNFTNLLFKNKNDYSSLDMADDYNEFNPLFQNEDFLTGSLRENCFEKIKEYIDGNKYIIARINKFFIPGTQFYNIAHFVHGSLIYGYDFEKEKLHVLTFNSSSVLAFLEISFSDFMISLENTKEDAKTTLLTYNNADYDIDADNLILQIKNYSKGTKLSENQNRLDGISIYNIIDNQIDKFLKEDFNKFNENNYNRDLFFLIKNFHVMSDHKKCMQLKFKFLEENNIIKNEKTSVEFENLSNDLIVLRNYLLKYRITKNMVILDKIKPLYEKIKNNEKKALDEFIHI
jgi:dTMP kinase